MKKRLSLKKKCLLSFSILLIPLIFAEIAIRLLNLSPQLINQPFFTAAEDLPYLFTANYVFKGRNQTDEFDLDDKTNSIGFIDDEWSLKKPKNEKRIIFIGDSFTAGIGRGNIAAEYTNEVEKNLKSDLGEHKVNVLNMGVAGFWPEPERIVLERYGFSYSPDAVVVNFLANDVLDTHHGIDAVKLGQSGYLRARHENNLGTLGTWLYIHSHLCRIILKKVAFKKRKGVLKDNFDEIFKVEEGAYKEEWLEVLDEYRQMKKLCHQKNIPLFLVYHCLPKSWTDDFKHVEKYIKDFCHSENIHFISVRAQLNALSKKELIYFPLDGHYQDNANILTAKKVAAVLKEQLFK